MRGQEGELQMTTGGKGRGGATDDHRGKGEGGGGGGY